MLTYDIFSLTDDIIKGEMMTEVTSSKIFIRENEPDPEGLASYEIFGYPGTLDRKNKFGFIQLNDIFIHPHCLFELKSIKRYFADIVNGDGKFYIKNGDLVRVDEGKVPTGVEIGTGTKFLYDNWEKLKFNYKELKSGVRFNRLRFMDHLTKDQVFIDKLVVIPAFYRDVDMREGGNKNEVNCMYISIINYAETLKTTSNILGTFDEVSDSHRLIQQALVDFHEEIIKRYGGRKGFIHKYIMGKNVDFSARLVISCMDIQDSHTPDEMVATFDKSIAPLFAIIKCFAPFIINGVEEIIKDFLQGSEYVIINENGYISKDKPELAKTKTSNQKYRRVKLASDWQKVLTLDYINNLIELYHDSHEHRLDLFTLPLEDGGNVPVGFYVNDDQNIDLEVDILTAGAKIQPLRLVHLFYIAAVNKIADKHIYITRYPIEDHNNTYPSRMNIIPYARTGKVMVGDTVYDHFPIVNYEEDMKNIYSMFIDSLIIFPGFLSALDGDFDGDQLSIIGIFTKEANQEAENFIHSVSNMISIDGSTSRELGKLCGHVIHIMTI